MKKITLLLLLSLCILVAKAQTYQLNYDSIRVNKTTGTGGTSLYGKVYLKNVSARAVGDSILSVLNGRIFKVPYSGVNLWQRSGTTLSPRTANDSLNIGTGIYKGHGAKSDASDGFLIESSTGVDVGRFGVANTANASLFGGLSVTGAISGASLSAASASITASNGLATTFANNATSFETLRATNSGSGLIASFRNSGGEVASIGNTGIITLADEAYSSSWNGKLEAPTKNAIWDAFGSGGGFWSRSGTTLSPTTANDFLSVTSNSGSSIEGYNSGIGALAFYGSSTNGPGAQFQSGSSGSPGLTARNTGGGVIQNWLNTSSQVAQISNTGSISSTPQGTLYGTASGSITSSQLATSLTDETGTGSAVFSASPTLTGTALADTIQTSVLRVNTIGVLPTGFTTQKAGINGGLWMYGSSSPRTLDFLQEKAGGFDVNDNYGGIDTYGITTAGGTQRASFINTFVGDNKTSLINTGMIKMAVRTASNVLDTALVIRDNANVNIKNDLIVNKVIRFDQNTDYILWGSNVSVNPYIVGASDNALTLGTGNFAGITMSSARAVRFHAYGAGSLTTDASGNITATSDERLKDISKFYTAGLSALKNIKPITYKWKPETKLDTANFYTGFSAQNIHKNIPEASGHMVNGDLTIQDRAIMATIINAINELNAKIEELEARITALEAQTQPNN
jgi:hypothetical protein